MIVLKEVTFVEMETRLQIDFLNGLYPLSRKANQELMIFMGILYWMM